MIETEPDYCGSCPKRFYNRSRDMRLFQAFRAAGSLGIKRATTRVLSDEMPQTTAESMAMRGGQGTEPRQRRYIDYIIVGVSMTVATGALQARINHQDQIELLEARILRCQQDSKSMLENVDNVRNSLLEDVDKGVATVIQSRDKRRAQNLLQWVESHFESADASIGSSPQPTRKPTII